MNLRLLSVCLILSFYRLTAHSQQITFSELNYNSDSTINSGNWVELFNYGSTNIDLGGWFLKDDNNVSLFTFPTGTNLAANARLVVVNDVAKFTEQFPLITNYLGEMSFSFGNSADEVRLFDNNGTLKVFMSYTDTLPWPNAADGTGRTLELIDPLITPDNADNWFVGCMKGSPGKAFSACDDALVFSEINYNSDTLSDAGDWIELYNKSTSGVNLTGWSFKDSNDGSPYFFPTNTQIASGARLVIVHDLVKFQSRHPTVTNYVGPFTFNLSNDGELVRLFNFSGKLAFSVVYDDDGDWPEGADGGTYTLELLSPTGNMNSFANWFIGCPEGSPGKEYTPNCNVGIPPSIPASFAVTTSLQYDIMTIHFSGNESGNEKTIAIYNILGQELFHQQSAAQQIDISTGDFSKGIYVLSVRSADVQWSQKFFIH
ncbi:MAG: lamin tail domain-containing protein [Chitinophagales bacterium]